MSSRKVHMKMVNVTIVHDNKDRIELEQVLNELNTELKITVRMVKHINKKLKLK